MILEHFKKKSYRASSNIDIQPDCIVKCPKCEGMMFRKELKNRYKICPLCGAYLRMNAADRINSIVDENSFTEYFKEKKIKDPLNFPGYKEKQNTLRKSINQDEAVVCGIARIENIKVVIVVMDTNFMMGSMGSTVGEKITKSIELAIKKSLPLIIFSASGGARMQEGMFSLMQMAKTSQALAKFGEKKLLFISVMTHPTTGGVSASFASLGDIIIAEKGALIGFAGPRVIEQVTGKALPEGFQKAEFLLEHGLVDMVLDRTEMREKISEILRMVAVRRK